MGGGNVMKAKESGIIIVTMLMLFFGASTAMATVYPENTKAASEVSASIIWDSQSIRIPNPGPNNQIPPVINPNRPPEFPANQGRFALRYVSDILFTEVVKSKESQVTKSVNDSSFFEAFNHIVIQDFRNSIFGWEVTVELEESSQWIAGAAILFRPNFSSSQGMDASEITIPETVELSSEGVSALVMRSTSGRGIATINLSDSEGVQLSIPGGTKAGEYHTSLLWTLVSGI